jgi:hypothetical protein
VLTLQSVIVILVGWSAIRWGWTTTRLAVVIGFVAAYFVTLVVLAVRGAWSQSWTQPALYVAGSEATRSNRPHRISTKNRTHPH